MKNIIKINWLILLICTITDIKSTKNLEEVVMVSFIKHIN